MSDYRILTGVVTSPTILKHTYVPQLDETVVTGKISLTSQSSALEFPTTESQYESEAWIWYGTHTTPFPARLTHTFLPDQPLTEKHIDVDPQLESFEELLAATELEQDTFLSFGSGVQIIVAIIFLVVFLLSFFVNASLLIFVWMEKSETASLRSAFKWINLSQIMADILTSLVMIHLLIWLLVKDNLTPVFPCQLITLALSMSVLISMISHLVMMTIQFAITKTALKEFILAKLLTICKMYILLSWIFAFVLAAVLAFLEHFQHSEKAFCNLNLISRIIFPFIVIYFISLTSTFSPMLIISFTSCRADFKVYPGDENSDDNDSENEDQIEKNKVKKLLKTIKGKVFGKTRSPGEKCPQCNIPISLIELPCEHTPNPMDNEVDNDTNKVKFSFPNLLSSLQFFAMGIPLSPNVNIEPPTNPEIQTTPYSQPVISIISKEDRISQFNSRSSAEPSLNMKSSLTDSLEQHYSHNKVFEGNAEKNLEEIKVDEHSLKIIDEHNGEILDGVVSNQNIVWVAPVEKRPENSQEFQGKIFDLIFKSKTVVDKSKTLKRSKSLKQVHFEDPEIFYKMTNRRGKSASITRAGSFLETKTNNDPNSEVISERKKKVFQRRYMKNTFLDEVDKIERAPSTNSSRTLDMSPSGWWCSSFENEAETEKKDCSKTPDSFLILIMAKQYLMVCPMFFLLTYLPTTVFTIIYCSTSDPMFGHPYGSSIAVLAILSTAFLNPLMSVLKYLVIRRDFQAYLLSTAFLCAHPQHREIIV